MTKTGQVVSQMTGGEAKLRPMEFLVANEPALKILADGRQAIAAEDLNSARNVLVDFISGVRDDCRQSSLIHSAAMDFDSVLDGLKQVDTLAGLERQIQAAESIIELYSNVAQASVGRAYMNGLKATGIVGAAVEVGEFNDKAVLTWLDERGIETAARDSKRRQIYQNLLDYTQLNEQDLLQGVHFFFDEKKGVEALGINHIRKGDDYTVVRMRPKGIARIVGIQALTLEDEGTGIKHIGSASKEALALMIAYAQKNGWSSVQLSGPPENAADLTRIYHAFVAAGIAVEGFKPSFTGDNPFLNSTSLTMTEEGTSPSIEADAADDNDAEVASKADQEAFDRLYDAEQAASLPAPQVTDVDNEKQSPEEEMHHGFRL